jgi:hypothetical protein
MDAVPAPRELDCNLVVRVDKRTFMQLKQRARADHRTSSDVVRMLLEQYLADDGHEAKAAA